MANMYKIMRAMQQHVASFSIASLNMLDHLVYPIEDASTKRQKWIVTDLYYGIALFNPHLNQNRKLYDNIDAWVGLMKVFCKLFNTN
jgi:hypothetical protein